MRNKGFVLNPLLFVNVTGASSTSSTFSAALLDVVDAVGVVDGVERVDGVDAVRVVDGFKGLTVEVEVVMGEQVDRWIFVGWFGDG